MKRFYLFPPERYAWDLLQRAYHHLGIEFCSWASFQARGFYLPQQQEALDILLTASKQVRN